MLINVPSEYLITIGEDSWMAEYVGTGSPYDARYGFTAEEAAERYPVPEGTLMVSPDMRACQLVTAERELGHHYYRLRRF